MVALARAAGAAILFVNPNYKPENAGDPSSDAVWQHRRIVEDISKRMDVPVVDLHTLLDYPQGEQRSNGNYKDEVHFSEEGADAAARIIARAIVSRGLLRFPAEPLPALF
jgi:lysophospholipase L1-like esterase